MIYVVIFAYIFLLSFIYDFGDITKGRNINHYLILIILICLSGFRYKVGGDTYNYMIIHDYIPTLSKLPDTDIGFNKLQPLWLLLSSSAKSINKDFFVVQLIHAIIVNSIIFYFIKKNTKYTFTAILLYYIGYYPYFNFEILRESLAICMFLISISFYNTNKWRLYYMMAIMALMFHYSALILFILPVFKRIDINYLVIAFIFVIGIVLNAVFLKYVNSINYEGGFFASMKAFGDYKYTLFGLISIAIYYIFYPAIVIKICEKHLRIKSRNYAFLNMYIIIGASTSLFFIFFRFLNYFTPILFILLAEMLHGLFYKIDPKPLRMSFVMIVFVIIAFVHCNRYFSDTSRYVSSTRWYSHWYPYHSVFDRKTDAIRERLINSENNLQQK